MAAVLSPAQPKERLVCNHGEASVGQFMHRLSYSAGNLHSRLNSLSRDIMAGQVQHGLFLHFNSIFTVITCTLKDLASV